MWFLRALSSVLFLALIIFTIPLTFDVGGRTCGLAFSLSLSSFYFLNSSLRLATPDHSRFRNVLVTAISWSQWIVIPTLMIWSLNKFSVDSNNNGSWVEKTFDGKRAEFNSVGDWLFGRQGLVENLTIGGWDMLLRYSVPVFQVGEGFCSLLVIQALGQITRWLVNRERGDTWMVSWRPLEMLAKLLRTDNLLDWPSCVVRQHPLELRLLPVASDKLSRNRHRRRHPHRSVHYLCRLLVLMGHWKWPWQPRGKLFAGQVFRPLLQTFTDIILH